MNWHKNEHFREAFMKLIEDPHYIQTMAILREETTLMRRTIEALRMQDIEDPRHMENIKALRAEVLEDLQGKLERLVGLQAELKIDL